MQTQQRNPWFWIPSLYYAEGIPFSIVMFLSVVMYKGFGISNTDIALYTSWLYLPWAMIPSFHHAGSVGKTSTSSFQYDVG